MNVLFMIPSLAFESHLALANNYTVVKQEII